VVLAVRLFAFKSRFEFGERGHRGRDRMVVGFNYLYICN